LALYFRIGIDQDQQGVESELSCPVLVAGDLSASSGSVLLVGMWAKRSVGEAVVHLSTSLARAAERI
jgi:hypothetical protein